jgi:transposase
MRNVAEIENIRRAYYQAGKSKREIGRELGCSYHTIQKALQSAEVRPYTLRQGRRRPVLGPYEAQIEVYLSESEQLPRKQRYTAHKIYERLCGEHGYGGCESTVRHYVGQSRRSRKRPEVYLPLEFDPGVDGQVDWGEAWVEMGGERVEVQLFVLRLCYSRKVFSMAFPTQRQEAFFAGHVAAFAYLGGVPHRLSYDNLKTAVQRILTGRNREEQAAFITFRSHYLFESRFCTPGEGHEKGGVESAVGYVRRNFLSPLPQVASFSELNAHLLAHCQADDQRHVERQTQRIAESWQEEQPHLRPLPAHEFACCRSQEVTLNGYGQVTFETNRYSVPVPLAQKQLTLKAYPFVVEIVANNQIIASHARCYGHKQDILDPLHYLSLLEQRPGAFEHAKPLRQWRATWPPLYEKLLTHLRERQQADTTLLPAQQESRAIREFIRILMLHQEQSAEVVAQAIELAFSHQMVHLQGVQFYLNQLLHPVPDNPPLDLSARPDLARIGTQPVGLEHYNQRLTGGLSCRA